jgi:hypothetical protein
MSSDAAPRRVVLLGASNLTRGFGTAIEIARARLGAPLEVFAALGHGRSYGPEPSSFLYRTLPGIASSGLWARLAAEPPRPTHALVTDLGNDVAFGVAPARVAGWLAQALDRLAAAGARPVITGLPIERLEALDPLWFAFWSRLFFPGRALERERVLAAARELEGTIESLTRARGLAFVPARPEWSRLFGIRRTRVQPAARLADGSMLSMY